MLSNIVWVIIIIIVVNIFQRTDGDELRKVCKGTTLGFSRSAVETDRIRYTHLERVYRGCEYVETNLEIVGFIDVNENMTFDFLKSIKEVFGYVLIAITDVALLPLDGLTIIRGHQTRDMKDGSYSLVVQAWENPITVHMPKLKEISNGSVNLVSIEKLCFLKTINWTDIVRDPRVQRIDSDSTASEDLCPPCHRSCREGGCWGRTEQLCQQFNRIGCNPRCKNRCVIGNPNQCCDNECSVGCSSERKSDCFACQHVVNNGTCEKECPRKVVYDSMLKVNKVNPEGKYVYAQQCIAQCPRDMFVEQDSCVSICSPGYRIDFENFLCKPCGEDCPISCRGKKSSLTAPDLIEFKGCSIVHGTIHIGGASFNSENASITTKDLQLLENIQLVTDSVIVKVNRSDFRSLNFLRNLRIIQGQEFYDYDASLIVTESSLTELGLDSLKSVVRGNVVVYKNPNLCYVGGLRWADIKAPGYKAAIVDNKPQAQCESEGRVCDAACASASGCMGPRKNQCLSCSGYTYLDLCLLSCLNFSIPLYRSDGRSCSRCHGQCADGCHGPLPTQCWSCANYKWNSTCVDVCPVEMTHNSEYECVSRGHVAMIGALSALAGLILVTVLVLIVMYHRKQLAKTEEKKLMIAAQLTGVMEYEPLKPTTIQPNMAQLKLIKESELRCGGVVGSGAFGTVYKGLWIPEGENLKIAVAIKVLQCEEEEEDEQGRTLLDKEQERQILDEAQIMASVVHPFCMHILAFCMGRRMMIVTQFMPQGCLLEYVQGNRNRIGSKHVLNWSSQIAKGMEYLEGKSIIHRDLAARNVLVHNPNHVRITDFGLAKLVPDSNVYLSEGGKLPIKWLALECIREKIFTHKSDVWSYGVTLWEICTFGQRPYENIPIQDFVQQLEKGERLPQPSICTIDVFMVMIKCWLVDAESRPTFKELADTFTQMAQDPGRFLVIENDELKRIPSEAKDTLALLRTLNMGPQEGTEDFITADEYLQLKGRASQGSDQSGTDASNHVAMTVSRSGQRAARNRPQVPLLISSDQEFDMGQSSSGSEPRYTPDPTRYSSKVPFDVTVQEEGSGYNPSTDNYLIPRSRGQPQYLELINECESNADLVHATPKRNPQDANISPISVENPEYFGDQI